MSSSAPGHPGWASRDFAGAALGLIAQLTAPITVSPIGLDVVGAIPGVRAVVGGSVLGAQSRGQVADGCLGVSTLIVDRTARSTRPNLWHYQGAQIPSATITDVVADSQTVVRTKKVGADAFGPAIQVTAAVVISTITIHERSEERRVGKECSSRWSAYHSKKKAMHTI